MATYCFDLDGTVDICPSLVDVARALKAAGHHTEIVTGNGAAEAKVASLKIGDAFDKVKIVGPVDHSAEKVKYMQSVGAVFLFDNDISNITAAAAGGIPGAVFAPTADELADVEKKARCPDGVYREYVGDSERAAVLTPSGESVAGTIVRGSFFPDARHAGAHRMWWS